MIETLKVARRWGAVTWCTLTRRAALGRYRYPKMNGPAAIFDQKSGTLKYHYMFSSEVPQEGEKAIKLTSFVSLSPCQCCDTSKPWKLAQKKLDRILTWEAGSLFHYRVKELHPFPANYIQLFSISTHSIAIFLFEEDWGQKKPRGGNDFPPQFGQRVQFW